MGGWGAFFDLAADGPGKAGRNHAGEEALTAQQAWRSGTVEKLDLEVVPDADGWTLVENGNRGTAAYATREAAFEAVIGPASNALKEGLEVAIRVRAVPGRTLE